MASGDRKMRLLVLFFATSLTLSFSLLHNNQLTLKKNQIIFTQINSNFRFGIDNNVEKIKTNQRFKNISKVLGTIFIFSSLLSPAAFAKSGLEAGQLFTQSEQAIEITQKNFKNLETEWNKAKKIIDNNFQEIKKVLNTIQFFTDELTILNTKLEQFITFSLSASELLQNEINSLILSTSEKYEIAEASSKATEKPSITADLFVKAQNEAILLTENQKILRLITSINNDNQELYKKTNILLNNLQKLSQTSVDIEKMELQSVKELEESLTINSKFCKDSLNECDIKGFFL
jgi:hypothetical protein